jgi:hypothetical protein
MPSILLWIMRIRRGWTIALCIAAACQGELIGEPRSVDPTSNGGSRSSAASLPPVASDRSCPTERTVAVPARSNIFGAGINELPAPAGGGGGVPPACVTVADDVRFIRVAHVTGSISFVGPWFNRGGVAHRCAAGAEVANASSDSDGVRRATTCGWEPDGGTIDAAGVVSSITSSDRVGYLVAVFLPDSPPVGPAPVGLRFDRNYDFVSLRPALAQVFFVGDGRTSDGSVQRFRVPEGAARVYLGIADAFAFRGLPGFYDDNSGSFLVKIAFR